jgi:hypothetical protein
MATHDYNIANQTGANFRADLNNALAAIVSNNYGSTDPATVLDAGINGQCQWWADSATGLLKLRNTGDTDWVVVGSLSDAYLGLAPFAYYRLNSALTGADVNTAQNLFGVGISLAADSVYEFEMVFRLNKTGGTTVHTVGIGFGGTAGITNIAYVLTGVFDSAVAPSVTVPDVFNYVQTASNTTMTSSSSTSARDFRASVFGTVSTNATAGTFIPQYTLSNAPGGAYTTSLGSYVKLRKIGTSGSNVNIGGWA